MLAPPERGEAEQGGRDDVGALGQKRFVTLDYPDRRCARSVTPVREWDNELQQDDFWKFRSEMVEEHAH